MVRADVGRHASYGTAALLIAFMALSGPATATQAEELPYSKQQLLDLLKRYCGSRPRSFVEKVQDYSLPHLARRGVDFRLTLQDEAEFRAACATEKFLAAIRSNNRCPPQPLRLGETAQGQLSKMCPVREYRVEVPCGGLVLAGDRNAESKLVLELINAAGEILAEGCPLKQEVSPGTYYLRVRAGEASGDVRFELPTAFGCPTRQLTLSGDLVDTIAESDCTPAVCRIKGFPAELRALADNYLHNYELVLDQRGSLVVDFVSSEFDPYLVLLDYEGGLVGRDDNGGGGTSARLITQPLRAGTYTLLAIAQGRKTGQYRLRTAFKARSCFVGTLPLGGNVTGRISEDDCHPSELLAGSSDEKSYAHQYGLQIERPESVMLELKVEDWDARLELLDAGGKLIASDGSGPAKRTLRVSRTLTPGNYRVIVLAHGAGGGYSLASSRGCMVRRLPLNGLIADKLSEYDCEVNGRFVDFFRLTARSDVSLSVEVSASGFSPWLVLYRSDGKQLASQQSSRLVQSLGPGSYLLLVGQLGRGSGAYELRTSTRSSPCSLKEIGLEATESGKLSSEDCRREEVMIETAGRQFVDLYRFRVPYHGDLTVGLSSPDFDPQAILINPEYEEVRPSNSWAWAGGERKVWTLEPGDYWLGVSSRGISSGQYTVRTNFTPKPK